jgi:predicted nuclease of predicted toxin-antitoxin system
MKLLFDQNISHRLISLIQDILPEARQVRQIGLENSSDKQIWEYAKEHNFTISLL